MRSACVLSALVAIVAAAPAPSPQLIDLAGVDAAPDPVFVSAPFDVVSDTPHKKRELTLVKRDGNCAPQPAGSGPVSTPDTAAAFKVDAQLQVHRSPGPSSIRVLISSARLMLSTLPALTATLKLSPTRMDH